MYPLADGATQFDRRARGAQSDAPRDGEKRQDLSADQLQARRDARLHEVRLQHGKLPRVGPRQGRLPPVALWLRSGRRLSAAHPRNQRPADQPRHSRREPAHPEGVGQSPAHRRQAVCRRVRDVPDADALAEGRAPAGPGRSPQGRRGGDVSQRRRARRQGSHAATHRAGQICRRDRPRRDVAGLLHDEQRRLGRRLAGGRGDGRCAGRSVHHGPVLDLHRRQAVHRASQGAQVRVSQGRREQLHRHATSTTS